MNIVELNKDVKDSLTAFKDSEYPEVDREHYGENLPNFTVSEFTLVAKEGEDISGYININLRLGIAYISSLLVGKKYQGSGVGRNLVEEAEKRSKEMGAHKIWLETGENWKAKEFYEKLGYKVRTILPNDAGHQDFVLMDKML